MTEYIADRSHITVNGFIKSGIAGVLDDYENCGNDDPDDNDKRNDDDTVDYDDDDDDDMIVLKTVQSQIALNCD
jgi:hypothetical protein